MGRNIIITLILSVGLAAWCSFSRAGEDFLTTLEGDLIKLDAQPVVTAPANPVYVQPQPHSQPAPLYQQGVPQQTYPSSPSRRSDPLAPERLIHHDTLPRRLLEMDMYERMAMEPFPDYDRMPTHEKARVYSQQFEAMRGRRPNFAPSTQEEIRASELRHQQFRQGAGGAYAYGTGDGDGGKSIYDAIKYMYKPPPPPQPQKKEVDLNAIPGPWGSGAKEPEPSVSPDTVNPSYTVLPDGSIRFDKDARMETMRQGWNVKTIISGRR